MAPRIPFLKLPPDSFDYFLTVLAATVPFLKTLNAEFVFDDIPAVVTNDDVLGRNSLWDLFSHDFWGNDVHLPGSHKSWRPLTTFSFRLTASLFGLSPSAFHAGNVLLHAVVSCLVYKFCGKLGISRSTKLAATIFFCIHPVHCEAVAGVVGRADILSALFVLLGFFYHGSFEEPLGVILFSILSLLSKETGLMLLPIAVAYSLILKPIPSKKLFILISAFIIIAFARISYTGSPKFSSSDNPLPSEKNFFTRTATTLYLPIFHLFLLLFPKDLCFDWSMGAIPLVSSLSDPRFGLSLVVYIGALCFAVFLIRRKMRRQLFIVTMSIFAFIPASNLFVFVGFLAAERVLYLPSVGFCILTAYWLEQLCKTLKISFSQLSFVVFCVLCSRTLRRNDDWMTAEALYGSAVHLNPPKAWANLGQTLASKGLLEEAVAAYDKALRHRNMADTWYNLGVLQTDLGNHTEAARSYSTAISIRHSFAAAHLNLGMALWRQGQLKEAERVLTRCLEIDGSGLKNWRFHEEAQIGCRLQRGRLRMKNRSWERAAEDFRKVISSTTSTNHFAATRFLAETEIRLGLLDEAESRLHSLLEKEPNLVKSLILLSQVQEKKNQTMEAIETLRNSLKISEDCLECLSQLGLLLADRNPAESQNYLRKAAQLEPKGVHLLNYGVILHKNGKFEEAEKVYRRVLEKNPGDKLAEENLRKLLRTKSKRVTHL